MRPASSPAIPVLVCTLAIFLLSAMDAGMKTLVAAAGVYNTVLWRTALATGVAAVAYGARSRVRPGLPALGLHGLRALVVGIILISFFWGLARLPLAVGIGLSFMAPLFALFLAALLLGERISARAIQAAVLGLCGVAVILWGQFGSGPSGAGSLAGAVAILVSAVFYG